MPRRLSLTVLLALPALAAVPAVASAGWFGAQPVDGPTPDIDNLGGVDLASDGTGGLVYLKRVDGTPHVFLSRFNGGQFRAPERVDNGIGAGASEAAIAAADADRLAIVWIAGSRVYGSLVTGNDEQPGPLLGPTELYNDPSGPVSDVAIDSRGQETPSRTRVVRFDNQGPRLTVKVVGKRRARRALRIMVRASDGKGSGVLKIRVRYGDSKRVVSQRGKRFRAVHAYRRGRFTLRVTGYDKAGNRRVKIVRLRIS